MDIEEVEKSKKRIFPEYEVNVDKKHYEVSGKYKCTFKSYDKQDNKFVKSYEVSQIDKKIGDKLALKFGFEAKLFFDEKKDVICEILTTDNSYQLSSKLENRIKNGFKPQGSPFYSKEGSLCILVIKSKLK